MVAAPQIIMNTPELLTYQEAAALLHCSTVQIRRIVALRRVPCVRIGRTPLLRVADVNRYVDEVAQGLWDANAVTPLNVTRLNPAAPKVTARSTKAAGNGGYESRSATATSKRFVLPMKPRRNKR